MEGGEERLLDVGEKQAIRRVLSKYVSKPTYGEQLGLLDDVRDLIPSAPRLTFSIDGYSIDKVRLPWRDLSDVGWCSVVGAISDHVAKGSTPRDIVVALGVPSDWSLRDLDEFYRGVHEACVKYGLRLLGGDLNESSEPWVTVAVIGYTGVKKPPRRCCGRPGDVVVATGIYGAMGYVSIHGIDKAEQTHWVVKYTKRPIVYAEVSIAIAQNYRFIHASMDVSDGLGSTLLYLINEMKHGVDLMDKPMYVNELNEVCVDEECIWRNVLNGGEEYGVVLIIDNAFRERIIDYLAKFKIPFKEIGLVNDKPPHLYLNGKVVDNLVLEFDQFIGWRRLVK